MTKRTKYTIYIRVMSFSKLSLINASVEPRLVGFRVKREVAKPLLIDLFTSYSINIYLHYFTIDKMGFKNFMFRFLTDLQTSINY